MADRGQKQSKRGLPKRTGRRGTGGAKHGATFGRTKDRKKQSKPTGVILQAQDGGPVIALSRTDIVHRKQPMVVMV